MNKDNNTVEVKKKGTNKIVSYLLLFILLMGLSGTFVMMFLNSNKEKVINYSENGITDYKVYLKQNDFYESDYLNKDMYYVASLIDKINVDFNYNFNIDAEADMNFTYSIVGNLKITDELDKNTYFKKDYILLEPKQLNVEKQKSQSINETLSIDYDYYNKIANDFKSVYGLDTSSSLTLYLKISKNIRENEKTITNTGSDIALKIPLSQRAIDIKMDDTVLSDTKSYVQTAKMNTTDYIYIGCAGVLFIVGLGYLLKLMVLVVKAMPKKSKYEEYVRKLLREYDRLIVETSTQPNYEGKEIITINRIEELLDARDNLKMPVIYFNYRKKRKCTFHVEKEGIIYLMTVNEASFKEEEAQKQAAKENAKKEDKIEELEIDKEN